MLDLALLGHAGQSECRLCANGADGAADLETVRAAFESSVPMRRGRFPGVQPAIGLHGLMTMWEGGRLPAQNEDGRSTCFCGRRRWSQVSQKNPSRKHRRREEAPRLNSPPFAPTPNSKSPVGIASRLAFETCRRYRNTRERETGPIGQNAACKRAFSQSNRPHCWQAEASSIAPPSPTSRSRCSRSVRFGSFCFSFGWGGRAMCLFDAKFYRLAERLRIEIRADRLVIQTLFIL